jgi:ParB/RepB/Spo0J family partition protein
MDPGKLGTKIEYVKLSAIEPNPDNPRGAFEKDSSFSRLVDSIRQVGAILVPLVVMKLRHAQGEARFRLVDGERRYWAAKELALERVPANVVDHITPAEIRKLMFHLHMTREQWGPLAQCRALTEAYKALDAGIKFSEKAEWESQIARELNMSKRTARDRVHFLAWPKNLKDEVFDFNVRQPKKDIYSYVLAIEASVVSPSVSVFPELYDSGRPPEIFANHVREKLFEKTAFGLERGLVVSREQIRDVEPLFADELRAKQHHTAATIFKKLVDEESYFFQDARSEIEARLPGALREKPPRPRRLVANIRSLARALELYRADYLDLPDLKRDKVKMELKSALDVLENAITQVRARLK